MSKNNFNKQDKDMNKIVTKTLKILVIILISSLNKIKINQCQQRTFKKSNNKKIHKLMMNKLKNLSWMKMREK